MVAQAEHALKVVHRELLVEQAHQFQVARTFATGLVVEATARQPQGLAARACTEPPTGSGDWTRARYWAVLIGAAVFLNSAFSVYSRLMAA